MSDEAGQAGGPADDQAADETLEGEIIDEYQQADR